MRYARFALVLLGCGLAACGSVPDEYPEEDVIGSGETEFSVDPKTYDITLSELGTELVRPIAKCLEWPGIGTEEGTQYHNGTVVVDRIDREDADHNYGVRVRLKNTSEHVLKLEYLVRFYNRNGGMLAGYLGHSMRDERWTPFLIEPFNVRQVGDFCRVMGAEGFRLFIRGSGSALDGSPYDPSKEEPR